MSGCPGHVQIARYGQRVARRQWDFERELKNGLSLKLRWKMSYVLQVIWLIPEELKKE
jgi:hypothetical protein